MKFDAYNGNVWNGAFASEVAEVIAHECSSRVERGRPRGRYSDVFDIKDGTLPVGWVARDHVNNTAYFECKGVLTPQSSDAIRKHYAGAHTVSRLDSCEDFDELGAFERLVELADLCKDPRVHSLLLAPRDADRGRTINYGSPKSRLMMRLYEKGKMKEQLHAARPNWARAEVEVRPGKAAEKRLAASITPLDAWGFAAWSQRLAERLANVDVTRFAPVTQPACYDKTTLYFARAFRRHITEKLADLGDWVCIGREVQAIWDADDEAKRNTDAAIAVAFKPDLEAVIALAALARVR